MHPLVALFLNEGIEVHDAIFKELEDVWEKWRKTKLGDGVDKDIRRLLRPDSYIWIRKGKTMKSCHSTKYRAMGGRAGGNARDHIMGR